MGDICGVGGGNCAPNDYRLGSGFCLGLLSYQIFDLFSNDIERLEIG